MPTHPGSPSRLAMLVGSASAVVLLLAGCVPSPALEHPVATFQVAGDQNYKIELVTPALVKHAEQLLNGENVSAIPLGRVIRNSPGVNAPWSWHIDPATLEFAFVTIEVCDGLPSYVEDRIVTSDDYCPWSAKVIAIDR